MIREQVRSAINGVPPLILGLAGIAGAVWLFIASIGRPPRVSGLLLALLSLFVWFVILCGLKVVNPNEARVLQLFGRYRGTLKDAGMFWVLPFINTQRVSLRIRNFESSHLKVNDLEGNPIEIAAVVVWRVVDTAEALFEVDDYNNYVHVQSEAALRNLATSYPYDTHDDQHTSLRGHTAALAAQHDQQVADHRRLALLVERGAQPIVNTGTIYQ